MRALNARWRGIDRPTNVLSFPAAEPGHPGEARALGDIVLAFETVEREAAELAIRSPTTIATSSSTAFCT